MIPSKKPTKVVKAESVLEGGVYLSLVDIIFGVLIGGALLTLKDELVPIELEHFETWSIYVSFLIILLSWVFYHKAVFEQGLKISKVLIIDLFLLFLYFYILFSFENFSDYVISVTVMFGLYMLWSLVRDFNNKNKNESWAEYYKSGKNQLKRSRAIGIFLASILLLILHYAITTTNYYQVKTGEGIVDSITLFLITSFAILYRIIPYFDVIYNSITNSKHQFTSFVRLKMKKEVNQK